MSETCAWCDFPRTRRGLDTHPALTGGLKQHTRRLARARRAATLHAEGHSYAAIAAWMHVSESTVYKDQALLRDVSAG